MLKTWKRKLGAVFAILLLLVASGLGWLWIERAAVAEQAIARALADRGVAPASFRVGFLGFRSITLTDVDIGDGDALVDSLTVTYSAGELVSGRVRSIDAGEVRLRVRAGDGGLSFGALDPLVFGGGGGALSLPEIAVEHAEIALETQAGAFALTGPVAVTQSGSTVEVSLAGMTIAETGSPRVAPVVAAGRMNLDGGVLGFDLALTSAAPDAAGAALGHVAGSYDMTGGTGAIRAEGDIAFVRGGLMPQTLVPVIAPYYLDVTGGLSYEADIALSAEGVLVTADVRLDKLSLRQTAAGAASFSGRVSLSKGFGAEMSTPARMSLSALRIDDLSSPQRFAPVRVEGDAGLAGPALDWRLVVRSALPSVAGARLADVTGAYNLDTQKGNIRAAGELGFSPGKVELQTLLPALRGMVTRMSGSAAYVAEVAVVDGGFTSSGETTLKNVGFVTTTATFAGASGTVKLASLLPPRTRGTQTLRLRMLEAGLPLENGVVVFNMDRNGLRILDARWPFADGHIVLVSSGDDVFAPDARFNLTIEDVDLDALFRIVEVPGLSVTGRIGGTVPVAIRDGDPILLDGKLAAEENGIIVYIGVGSDIGSGEETKLLTDALRNFHYTELTGGLSGNANGELVLRLGLKGANPDLYDGYPFAINVKLEGSLADVIRRGTVGFRPLELIRDQSAPAVVPPGDKTGP
ncbi:YdbH domain-containing protein [Parvibaculum sp.]|uniref:intermembrane phospholipid transport protein YdbH family protein n=1 Tax=Parvibaculum sp. TaxID=2024848 RepID=UPI00349FE73C